MDEKEHSQLEILERKEGNEQLFVSKVADDKRNTPNWGNSMILLPLSGSAVIVELSMARKGWTSWIGKLATLLFLSKAAQIRGYTRAAISSR